MFKNQLGKIMEVYIYDMLVKSLRAEDSPFKGNIQNIEEVWMKLNPKKCAFSVTLGIFWGFLVS